MADFENKTKSVKKTMTIMKKKVKKSAVVGSIQSIPIIQTKFT